MRLSRRALVLGTASLALGACSDGADDDSAGTTPPTSSGTTTTSSTTAVPTTAAPTTTIASLPPVPPGLPTEVFALGVASGDPLPDSVILWTRLVPGDPEATIGDVDVPIQWELASDESFDEVVAGGTVIASPDHGHAVHVDATGLEPATHYCYRFRVGDAETSPMGATRTAPAPGNDAPLTFGFASCQDFQSGYYAAHSDMAAAGLDLVVWLGDYIYEYAAKQIGEDAAVRQHEGPEATTLDGYRARYVTYKRDPQLQASHAACPWVVLLDDHEVDNNYAGSASQDADADPAAFLRRRAVAYQAWWEHQPTRLPAPNGPDYLTYRTFDWGSLASFALLDTRQYRTDQACGNVDLNFDPACPEVFEPDRTLLGVEQEAWLFNALDASTSTWNVVAQQVVMSDATFNGAVLNYDQWDGYPRSRDRLLGHIAESGRTATVVISGDLHLAGVGRLVAGPDRVPVATELVGTSVSSQTNLPPGSADLFTAFPDIVYADDRFRGWTKCTLSPTEWLVEVRAVEDVLVPESPVRTAATFALSPDAPGARQVS